MPLGNAIQNWEFLTQKKKRFRDGLSSFSATARRNPFWKRANQMKIGFQQKKKKLRIKQEVD